MNKRIQELEKQATETVECGLNGTHTAIRFNRKKFAELIVRECCQKLENDGMVEVAMELKEHFGVE
jgi:hypothetical protein